MELYAALHSSALAKCQSSNSVSKGCVAVLTNEALNLDCLRIKVVIVKGQHHNREKAELTVVTESLGVLCVFLLEKQPQILIWS